MAEERDSRIFRRQALARSRAPERLDQLIRVINLADWIPLSALAVMVAVVLVWSVVGRIPVNVTGRAALIYPRRAGGEAQIVQFEAPGGGQLVDLRVNRGDRVTKGQLLAVIGQPELRKQLEMLRAKLDERVARQQTSAPLRGKHDRLTRDALAGQRFTLARRIVQSQGFGPVMRDKELAAVRAQQKALEARRTDSDALILTYRRVLDSRRELRAKGLINDAALFEAERSHIEARHERADIELQLRQLELKEVEIRKAYRDSETEIAEFQAQLADLDARSQRVALDEEQVNASTVAEIQELSQSITQLEHQLRNLGLVVSDTDGVILEINGVVGQMVGQGGKLGAIQTMMEGSEATGGAALQGVSYLTVGDGKRVRPGMKVQLTPDTVKRVEYGGITGKVVHVSAFAVSRESAANMVNSEDIAQELTSAGHQIEVVVDLDPDSAGVSGFKWSSSKGPNLKITAGTTGTLLVTVEERAPISLVLPVMRSVGGL